MKRPVVLSIRGRQIYLDQEPELIELVTEGVMEQSGNGWDLCYEESALTGMEGVTTTFHTEGDRIVLTRSGKLHSQMVFEEGIFHESLYQMEFGALMITVCATKVKVALDAQGGTIDLVYGIEIEQSEAGVIEYHLEIRTKE